MSVLRTAVIGSGPAGFYSAEALLRLQGGKVEVDVYDRLPVPYGLVRYGVAPDHQNIKAVVKIFERLAADPRFAFMGNVELGRDVVLDDLQARYDVVVIATGCETDRRLGIPGEDLTGSYPASEFVAWYNGHPFHQHHQFRLEHPRVAVVGVGNVAMDIARILLKDRDELAKTDVTDTALEALRAAGVREVVLLGRRGAAQVAFSPKEIEEIAALPDVDVTVSAEDAAVDPAVLAAADRDVRRNVEFLQKRAAAGAGSRPRKVHIKLLASPVEILGRDGCVCGLRVERNRLVERGGDWIAVGTGQFETMECGAVFRSIGYRGTAMPSVPFDPQLGRIPNVQGRVLREPGGAPLVGVYCAGWIKRGPTGLIGANKPDAFESVQMVAADLEKKLVGTGAKPPRAAVYEWLAAKGVRPTSFTDWKRIDDLEVAAGKHSGKIRRKFVSIPDMLAALGR